ncbi:MAG: DUF1289 domain-containing protein [Rhizobiaceae bacterium]
MDTPPTIESPCILVCAIEPNSGHCYGCGRSRDEIAGWINYSVQGRREIMEQLPARVAKLERKPRRVTKRSRIRGQVRHRDILDLSN